MEFYFISKPIFKPRLQIFFPALRAEQPVDPHVPSAEAEPPQDPQPGQQPRGHDGGPKGAQAPHLAQPRLQQHQGDRAPQPERPPRAPRPLGQRHHPRQRPVLLEKSHGRKV